MTNVSTLMALAVISLVASIGFAYAETVGDGTSEVHVYDFPFDVTVVEGGSVVIHNDSITPYSIEHTGTIGTDKSGTFSFNVNAGTTVEQSFPVEDCSSCYYAGTYYWKDTINGVTGSITIIPPEGWQPPVQEEVGITESVVVVLSGDSTSTITPEPTPIETSGIVVEMTENGFSQTSLFIEDGDSVTFVNTHVKANGNIEPHAISDPFAVPYTELSYWILANSEVSHTYTLDCDGYTFYDRFFDVPSITIECGTDVPEYTGGYTLLSLQQELAEITADLNVAMEEVGVLQNSMTNLNGIISDLESDVSERNTTIVNLETQLTQIETTGSSEIADLQISISTLETTNDSLESEKADLIIERDGWKQLSDNWYAVALEQVRVMVEVLGL